MRAKSASRGVQNTELRQHRVAARSALEHSFLFGDDRSGAALAAGRCDRQNGTDAQRFFNGLSAVEIPEIAVIYGACRDGFGGIDRTAAAYGKDKVDLFFSAQLDAFIDQTASGVGLTPPSSA